MESELHKFSEVKTACEPIVKTRVSKVCEKHFFFKPNACNLPNVLQTSLYGINFLCSLIFMIVISPSSPLSPIPSLLPSPPHPSLVTWIVKGLSLRIAVTGCLYKFIM